MFTYNHDLLFLNHMSKEERAVYEYKKLEYKGYYNDRKKKKYSLESMIGLLILRR